MRILPILLSWLVVTVASAADTTPATTPFAYAASIDAEGRIIALTPAEGGLPTALAPALDEAVREQLMAREYRVDPAAAAPVHTWLSGEFTLRDDGAEYVRHLAGLRAGPLLVGMKPPIYPPSLIRDRAGADVLLDLEVAVDGHARIAGFDPRSEQRLGRGQRGALQRAIEEAIARWRYLPERDARGARVGRVAVGVQLRITERPMDPGAFAPLEGAVQQGLVQVPAADFTPLTVQVTGSRVRRGSR